MVSRFLQIARKASERDIDFVHFSAGAFFNDRVYSR